MQSASPRVISYDRLIIDLSISSQIPMFTISLIVSETPYG
jgi:hypothetical protein